MDELDNLELEETEENEEFSTSVNVEDVTKVHTDHYGAEDIQVLEGMEAVRKRPGMYIASTSASGLHHLVWEIVDNGIDEAVAGFADEIDVTAARNPKSIYDLNKITKEVDIVEFLKHDAVKGLEINEKEFIMKISTDDEKIAEGLNKVALKMQKTLDNCRSAVNENTPYNISQEKVLIMKV